MTQLAIYGAKNVLKKDNISGSVSMAAPTALSAWFMRSNSTVIAHNLGYIPQVRVYYENSDSDGRVYPAGGRRNGGTYLGLPPNSIICLWELTTSNLTIYLESNTVKTGNRTVYYDIYKDF